jgi:hypothetical protein
MNLEHISKPTKKYYFKDLPQGQWFCFTDSNSPRLKVSSEGYFNCLSLSYLSAYRASGRDIVLLDANVQVWPVDNFTTEGRTK